MEEQCYEIIKPVLASALPAMGINRHFPRAVAYGPRSHQGLDIPNLYTEQLSAHILTLLWFGPQTSDPTGYLINMNVEAFQLEAGLGGPIFQMPVDIMAYMTDSWFTQTWYQCHLLQIEILTTATVLERPWEGDKEIMKFFLQQGIVGMELASMNRCRMFIKATYLSDICMGDGKYMDTRFWDGKATCTTEYQWPRMEKPTTYEWNTWIKNLTIALSLGWRDSLEHSLGNWNNNQRTKDGLFLEMAGDHLWTSQNGKWHIHTKIPGQS